MKRGQHSRLLRDQLPESRASVLWLNRLLSAGDSWSVREVMGGNV